MGGVCASIDGLRDGPMGIDALPPGWRARVRPETEQVIGEVLAVTPSLRALPALSEPHLPSLSPLRNPVARPVARPASTTTDAFRDHYKSALVDDLIAAGVRPGVPLLVHSSLSAIGRVPGGAETVRGV